MRSMVYGPPPLPLAALPPTPTAATPRAQAAFAGIAAADWRTHFAGKAFACVECGGEVVLPDAHAAPLHHQSCPACGCAYSIPLRGSFTSVNGEIVFSTTTAYGVLARDDFLARLTVPAHPCHGGAALAASVGAALDTAQHSLQDVDAHGTLVVTW